MSAIETSVQEYIGRQSNTTYIYSARAIPKN